ncbi:MAG: hypothetical protein IJM81_02185 [Prevotella sp.]|nr:hypothetical protein [Prevotella sp.]
MGANKKIPNSNKNDDNDNKGDGLEQAAGNFLDSKDADYQDGKAKQII